MRRVLGAVALLVGATAHAGDLSDVVFYDDGLRVETRDDTFAAHLEWRIQYRFAYPADGAPRTVDDIPAEPLGEYFGVRRARMRLGGHIGWKWLRYYTEVDLVRAILLDARAMFGKGDGPIDIWVGQFKVGYGRERQASSREQQFAERSLSNGVFAVDRQVGVEARSQFAETARLGWTVGVWFGNGALEVGDDPYPMVTGKVMVHPLGVIEGATQSDLSFRETPALSVAVGGMWTRGPYTAFTSAGGTQLAGFTETGADRYGLAQGLLDVGFAWRGLTVQGEANIKTVRDTELDHTTRLVGGYGQVGWLPHGIAPVVPEAIEVAFRASWVDPELGIRQDAMSEWTLATNAYVDKHRAKATAEIALLRGGGNHGWRGRVQWDFSF